MREARLRESDQRMFDVQLMGGIVLHEGDVAEMKTGEGKTFVASLALYLNALPTVETHDGRCSARASTSSPSTTTSPSATPSGTAASTSGSG